MSQSQKTVEYQQPTVKSVQIEASVALKIIQHCAATYHIVGGPLFGIDVQGDVLKITQSYRYPTFNSEGGPFRPYQNPKFQEDLVNELKELKSSTQPLGWYQSTYSGKFISTNLFEALAKLQVKTSPNSIVLIHDPTKASYGVLSLRAFRLTKNYIDAYTASNFSVDKLNECELSPENTLEELPVFIHNNHLISLYLSQFDAEEFNQTSVLESTSAFSDVTHSNVENLIESVDEMNTFLYYKKKQILESSAALQDWLPIAKKVCFTTEDVEQQVLSQFLSNTAIRP